MQDAEYEVDTGTTDSGEEPMPTLSNERFYLKIAHALSGCQLVEQELKLYITEAFDLVRKCVGDHMVFRMTGKDCANFALGQLVDTFRRLSDNKELVDDLKAFTRERNVLSHTGITHCLDYEGELSPSSAARYQKRLDAIQVEALRLRLAVHEEANKFRGHLFFDVVA